MSSLRLALKLSMEASSCQPPKEEPGKRKKTDSSSDKSLRREDDNPFDELGEVLKAKRKKRSKIAPVPSGDSHPEEQTHASLEAGSSPASSASEADDGSAVIEGIQHPGAPSVLPDEPPAPASVDELTERGGSGDEDGVSREEGPPESCTASDAKAVDADESAHARRPPSPEKEPEDAPTPGAAEEDKVSSAGRDAAEEEEPALEMRPLAEEPPDNEPLSGDGIESSEDRDEAALPDGETPPVADVEVETVSKELTANSGKERELVPVTASANASEEGIVPSDEGEVSGVDTAAEEDGEPSSSEAVLSTEPPEAIASSSELVAINIGASSEASREAPAEEIEEVHPHRDLSSGQTEPVASEEPGEVLMSVERKDDENDHEATAEEPERPETKRRRISRQAKKAVEESGPAREEEEAPRVSLRAAALVAKTKLMQRTVSKDEASVSSGHPEKLKRSSSVTETKIETVDVKEVAAAHEDEDLKAQWVQCDKCGKWRKLPSYIEPESLPDIWDCSMANWYP